MNERGLACASPRFSYQQMLESLPDLLQELAEQAVPLVDAYADQLPPLTSLSILDLFLLITLGAFALDGLRRGFILGTVDVIGLMATIAAATTLYPVAAEMLVEQVQVPGAIAGLLGFLIVIAVGQVVLFLAAQVIRALLVPIFLALPPIRCVDLLAGPLPGFVKGALVVALLVSTIRALPGAEGLSEVVRGSEVAARAVPIGEAVAPDLSLLLGRLGLGTIVIAPPPQAPASPSRTVRFPADVAPRPDPRAETRMLELLNQERAQAGLQPFTADDELRQVARSHSEEMFRRSYFAHESPVTGSPFDRLRRADVAFQTAGENLAYAPTVEIAHRGLMNSPGHRRNILNPDFRRVGIGIQAVPGWGLMVTQNFAG